MAQLLLTGENTQQTKSGTASTASASLGIIAIYSRRMTAAQYTTDTKKTPRGRERAPAAALTEKNP